MTDLLDLTRQLVGIESPTGHEATVTTYLEGVLESLGYRITRQRVGAGRHNLYAVRQKPVVVLSTHLDCVPPYVPFRETRTRIYGRGACDAKGIAAAMIAAAERLARTGQRRVGLLFLVGEETGGEGARASGRLAPRGRFMINGEPTGNRLVTAAKGSLRFELTAEGQAAHSAYPEEGRSAIDPLLDTLTRIRRLPLAADPVLGPATLTIGQIQGGTAPNVIPGHAQASLVFRTVTPTLALKNAVQSACYPGVTARVAAEVPGFASTAPRGWPTSVASFASDAPWLGPWGECFLMGPGDIRVAHTEDEHVSKEDLREGVAAYVKLARQLVRGG